LKKVLLLAALSTALALVSSAPVMAQSTSACAGASAPAQSSACDEVQDRLNAGDDSLTSAELLACGLSPEAISPCEGNPDPDCGASLPEGAYPSINGPNGVGTNNARAAVPSSTRSGLPLRSPSPERNVSSSDTLGRTPGPPWKEGIGCD